MEDHLEKIIKALATQAEKASSSDQAMKFSQAASNLAHAYATWRGAQYLGKEA